MVNLAISLHQLLSSLKLLLIKYNKTSGCFTYNIQMFYQQRLDVSVQLLNDL